VRGRRSRKRRSWDLRRSLRRPDEASVKKYLRQLYDDGYRSVAVVLAHSYTFPEHELLVGKVTSDLGFEHISLSSQLLPLIKMVSRGAYANAGASLTPICARTSMGVLRVEHSPHALSS